MEGRKGGNGGRKEIGKGKLRARIRNGEGKGGRFGALKRI